jgi:uncharacterized iron-regulated membrane protein
MAVLRWAVRIHKWVALIVGLQIVLWIAGGVVMSVIPIEQVRGEHKIAPQTATSVSPADIITLQKAAQAAQITQVAEASTGTVLGEPVWRLTSPDGIIFTIDAMTGSVLSPVNESFATQIAQADYSGNAQIGDVTLLTDPPSEYGRPGPVWQAVFADRDSTTLYVDPARAEVRARRSSTWRFYDFFWKLHIMDYDDGDDFNHPLLITAAGAAVFVALSGLLLLIIKMRRSFLAWNRQRASSP